MKHSSHGRTKCGTSRQTQEKNPENWSSECRCHWHIAVIAFDENQQNHWLFLIVLIQSGIVSNEDQYDNNYEMEILSNCEGFLHWQVNFNPAIWAITDDHCQSFAQSKPCMTVCYFYRCTWSCLSLAICSPGFNPLGQDLAQFMIVWQR